MLDSDSIDAIIAERYRLSKIFEDEWAYPIQLCWSQLTELLSKDINDTVRYLDKECTEEQWAWMSDVYDFVAKETKSKEFVKALYRLSHKYPEATKENHIMLVIEDAADIVNLDTSERK